MNFVKQLKAVDTIGNYSKFQILLIVPHYFEVKRFSKCLAVLRGQNGLMCLAAKGALACLLLEHVEATSFAIQHFGASKDD